MRDQLCCRLSLLSKQRRAAHLKTCPTADQQSPKLRQIALFYAAASTATANDQMRAALQVSNGPLPGGNVPRHFVAIYEMKPKIFSDAPDRKGRAALPCFFRASAQPLRLRQFAHCDAGGEW